jgi:hypothetical protein
MVKWLILRNARSEFVVGVVMIVLLGVLWLFYSLISAEIKADVLNSKYNTEYTWKELFYASDIVYDIHSMKEAL